MSDVQVPLLPTHYYHIFNHAIGKENIFERDEDYSYFISKVELHILPVCEILSYCLMPNHFHLIVQIKPEQEITEYLKKRIGLNKFNRKNGSNEYYICDQVSQHFSNLFNTYSKHYNFKKGRIGSLFKRAFRRTEISDMAYLRTVVYYAHQNPVEAGFVTKMIEWKYSSYPELVKGQSGLAARDELMELFGGFENFLAFHQYNGENT